MTTPTLVDVVAGVWDFQVSGRSVVTAAANVGDTLYAYSLSNFVTPVAPSGTWSAGVSAGLSNNGQMKAYSRNVTVAGAQTVTLPGTADSETALVVYLLRNVDSTDGQVGASGSGTSQAAGSVSPTGVDDLLICVWVCGNFSDVDTDYTGMPAGMTVDEEPRDLAYIAGLAAHQTLAASGATGTRTAIANAVDAGWAAITTAVKGSAGGTTPVGKDLGLVWNTRAPIGDNVQALWNTRAAIGDTVQAIWNTRIAVGDAIQALWSVRSVTGDSVQALWSVRAPVGDSLQLVWNVQSPLSAVGKNLGLLWNTRAVVGDTLQALWHLRALTGDSLDLRWDVRAMSPAALALQWSVRQSIGDAVQILWNTNAIAGDSLQLLWDVDIIGATAVGKDLSLRWDARAAIGDALAIAWSLRARLPADLQLLWDARGVVSDSIELRWGIRTIIGVSEGFVWAVRATAGRSVILLWDVEGVAYQAIEDPVSSLKPNLGVATVRTKATGDVRPNKAEATT